MTASAARDLLLGSGAVCGTRWRSMKAMFAPQSIALIGASDKPRSVGHSLMENLRCFDGDFFPINPQHDTVGGMAAFPHIGALPGKVDLAVIATPAATVPAIIRECSCAGVSAAVIVSAGFRETGPLGAHLEQECLAEARSAKLRLLGPNCLGLMVPRRGLNATFAAGIAKPGSVAFLSQSGALCAAVLDWSIRENVGFSAFVSMGSMLDIEWGELIRYFGDDPDTKSIVCYMESVGDARAFLSAARGVTLNKPIIVLKVGRTDAAARAATSHTGTLTGSDAVLDAAFHRVGVLRVNTIGELFDMAALLSKQPRPRGPHLTIVTNAGGPGALATDALIAGGGVLTNLSECVIEAVSQFCPSHWSHGNPIDLLGDANAAQFAKAAELAIHDSQSDGVLVILTPQSMTEASETAKVLTTLAANARKPLLASWMGGASLDSAKRILNDANIPVFQYPDDAAKAFSLMWRNCAELRLLYEIPSFGHKCLAADAGIFDSKDDGQSETQLGEQRIGNAETIIGAVRRAGRTLLTEVESKQLLTVYGIPTVETVVALTEEDAVDHAERIGFPVVVKLFSETLTHKTEVGGVHLDLYTPAAVRCAWRAIRGRLGDGAGKQHFQGVTVQPMVKRDGYEIILGSAIDTQFGPVLLFGAGGQLVEVFKDTVLGLPPLNTTLARRLMEQTKIYAALKGVRAREAVDLTALEQLLVRFSQLVVEQRRIAEIDINPLSVSKEGMLALDARVVLQPPECREEALPQFAIRPYPTEYTTAYKLPDGSSAMIRAVRPEDESTLLIFRQTFLEPGGGMRSSSLKQLDGCFRQDLLKPMCFIDYDLEMLLVVERLHPSEGSNEIVATGRLTKLHEVNEAEISLLVGAAWQGQGLGTELLKRLVQVGHGEKLERIFAVIQSGNEAMRKMALKLGFKIQPIPDSTESCAELSL